MLGQNCGGSRISVVGRASDACRVSRIPCYSAATLTAYWTAGRRTRARTVRYYLDRVQKTIELCDELDVVGRTRYGVAT